jgi:hypothetical protein
MTLLEAVRTGDRRKALVALRDYIAASLDETESKRDAAALTKRMMEVMEAIDAMPDPEADASPLDAAKRKRGGA